MNPNAQLIRSFYSAFQNGDYISMQNCYSNDAVFNDEVFKNLNSAEVKCMWEMLLKRSKDLQLEFKNIKADNFKGSAEWIATYTFSASQRKVVNHIYADFQFENGKIINHRDKFDFYNWARQALGLKGFLFGRTSFLRNKVEKTAAKNLKDFMNRKSS
ncbi:nuclear transport factor 2 family protein [Daejeonella oryzae]|uniref:nuclear transport factor 2 family protein n=1 Tax=Daejeonella oryzae TaxID=1122943 RepID=UPI0003F8A0F1|nr:nuclear transport factor 2 family protein [Daejeonella oryzae]